MTDPSAYFRALAAARDAALVLSLDQQRAFIGILTEYAREIEQLIAKGLESRTAGRTLREVSALIDAMSGELAGSMGDGIRLTARQVAEIQARATAALLSEAGASGVGLALGGTGARAAQAILARPELTEAFVSIRRDATTAANRIIARGILRGAPARAIAREIRQYIAMPNSRLERNGDLLSDQRRIGYRAVERLGYDPTPENLAQVRREASQIAHRASRIAITETMQAEAEAHRQGAEESPVVAFIEWRLSYRHKVKCACEILASEDLYGHGPGLFDPRNVPPRPHPFCRCVHRDVLRPPEEWGAPRGSVPELRANPELIAEQAGLSPSLTRSFLAAVEVGRRPVRVLQDA